MFTTTNDNNLYPPEQPEDIKYRYFVYDRFLENYTAEPKNYHLASMNNVSHSENMSLFVISPYDGLTDDDIYARYPDAREITKEEYEEMSSPCYGLENSTIANIIMSNISKYTETRLQYIMDPLSVQDHIDVNIRPDVVGKYQMDLINRLYKDAKEVINNPDIKPSTYPYLNLQATIRGKSLLEISNEIVNYKDRVDKLTFTILAVKESVNDKVKEAVISKDRDTLVDMYNKIDALNKEMSYYYHGVDPQKESHRLSTPDFLNLDIEV